MIFIFLNWLSGALVGVWGSDFIGQAPEFFETLYRNLAWALKALGRVDEAMVYFDRMAQSLVTDGIGTPDPDPRNLVFCCL